MRVENHPEIKSNAQESEGRYEDNASDHLMSGYLASQRESASKYDDEAIASMRGVRCWYRRIVFALRCSFRLFCWGFFSL